MSPSSRHLLKESGPYLPFRPEGLRNEDGSVSGHRESWRGKKQFRSNRGFDLTIKLDERSRKNGVCSGLYFPLRLGSARQLSQNYVSVNNAAVLLSSKQAKHITRHPNPKSVKFRKWLIKCKARCSGGGWTPGRNAVFSGRVSDHQDSSQGGGNEEVVEGRRRVPRDDVSSKV